jgi:hypothetical protein
VYEIVYPEEEQKKFRDEINGLQDHRHNERDLANGVVPEERDKERAGARDEPGQNREKKEAAADARGEEEGEEDLMKDGQHEEDRLREEKAEQSAVNEAVGAMGVGQKGSKKTESPDDNEEFDHRKRIDNRDQRGEREIAFAVSLELHREAAEAMPEQIGRKQRAEHNLKTTFYKFSENDGQEKNKCVDRMV